MGGDSAASEPESGILTAVSAPKVFKKDEYIIGYAGSFRMGKFIQYNVELPKPPQWARGKEKLDEFINGYVMSAIRKQVKDADLEAVEKENSGFLIALRGSIFEIDDAWAAYENKVNYASIGTGSHIALGSLYSTSSWSSPRKRLQIALEASSNFNCFVTAPYTFLEG